MLTCKSTVISVLMKVWIMFVLSINLWQILVLLGHEAYLQCMSLSQSLLTTECVGYKIKACTSMCTTQKFFLFCFVLICNSSVLAEADRPKVTTVDLVQCIQFVIQYTYKENATRRVSHQHFVKQAVQTINSKSITIAFSWTLKISLVRDNHKEMWQNKGYKGQKGTNQGHRHRF